MQELIDDFKVQVRSLHLRTPTDFDEDANRRYIFKKDDDEYKREWQAFHLQHALTQILCVRCSNAQRVEHEPCEWHPNASAEAEQNYE